MWPFPHLFISVALAEASFRWKTAGGWLFAAALAVLMASNMLTVNQYLYRLVRFGGAASWDDAIYSLSNQMAGTGKIITGDWGISNPLLTLRQGTGPVWELAYTFLSDPPSSLDEHAALEAFAEKESIWVSHTAGNEIFSGVNARVEKMAVAAGYQKIELGQVRDRNQRPMFDVFRFVPNTKIKLITEAGTPRPFF